LIQNNSISHFVNCAAAEVNFFWEGLEYLTFYWRDTPEFVAFDEHGLVLEQLVDFIDEGIKSGNAVLVHSVRGQSRSVACVVAYMMAKYAWGMDKVFEFLDSKRIPMDPNPGLLAQLAKLDWKLQRDRLRTTMSLRKGERERAQLLNRERLLSWSVRGLEGQNSLEDDLSADHLVLVNSFVNAQSRFSHSAVPPPADAGGSPLHHKRGAPQRPKATSIKWIDESEDGTVSEHSKPILSIRHIPNIEDEREEAKHHYLQQEALSGQGENFRDDGSHNSEEELMEVRSL